MNITERVKNIMLTPKTEWSVIETEEDGHMKVLTTYLMWLAAIPAIAAFIGYGIIGFNVLGIHIGGFALGIKQAIMQYIIIIGGAYLSALVFDFLATNFEGTKNFNRAFQLSAYCYTPICLGGIFYIHFSLSFLSILAGLYGFYLLYLGVKPMMKVPNNKATNYFVVSLLAMLIVFFVLGAIVGAIIGIGSVTQMMR
jgi:hypothetical protein